MGARERSIGAGPRKRVSRGSTRPSAATDAKARRLDERWFLLHRHQIDTREWAPKKKFLRSSVGESVRKTVGCFESETHPSIHLSRVRPPVHSSRVLVRSSRETRINETYFFRFIFSFRAERLGSVARARNAARFRPRASPR